MTDDLYSICTRFVRWLESRVIVSARGDSFTHLEHNPSGRFWLGRLAPEEAVLERGLGERGERLDPCAIGIRTKIRQGYVQHCTVKVRACYWDKSRGTSQWTKHELPELVIPIDIANHASQASFGEAMSATTYAGALGFDVFRFGIDVEVRSSGDPESLIVSILMVNRTPSESSHVKDTNLYEASFQIDGLKTEPFLLESLPDSFRYDRRVGAYGINCGISVTQDGSFLSVDAIGVDRLRPLYWAVPDSPPDLTFAALAENPIPAAQHLIQCLESWGQRNWAPESLQRQSQDENWSDSMAKEAACAADEFSHELARLKHGIKLLQENSSLLRAFVLMNEAMEYATHNKRYKSWRPFQFGFLLANLTSLVDTSEDRDVADIVWFATGGGKTETYLGLILTAAFYDRIRGKNSGVTAWSRFPLRMLSLQQTQRFADAMAAAEVVRRNKISVGEPFSVGFFVGQGATPNSFKPEPKENEPDIEDDSMPSRYKVLLRCPFCAEEKISMSFNRRLWRLEHQCSNNACEWPDEALPFYVVDDEIYRYLPTVIVGTLDKAASIAMQASMRGLVGAPHGICSESGHGFTYASRSKRPNGCLVPGCRGQSKSLPMPAELFGPTLRLQDELHLLKDSLGAVDAHYEALYDGLQSDLCGHRPKILASSATLTGYEKQVDVLYRRRARVFPVPPPTAGSGFWTADSKQLMRRFVALAPRGVTLEYMTDNLLTTLQSSIRWMLEDPTQASAEIGVPVTTIPQLVSFYGTNVVYGNTLRDLDAVERSLETQIKVEDGHLNTDSLTSRREFEDVRNILQRLEKPEDEFVQRLHVITASSMMSHGVDIDRLNSMCILGMPLTTAEFMQATARVGRAWPGLVFVAFKMARERDAAVYRLFEKYIEQGDRFVEPIPVTRRSRRVLDRTVAGLELARILMIHEPAAKRSLVSIDKLRRYINEQDITAESELAVLSDYLGLSGPLDGSLKLDLEKWLINFFRNLENPPPGARFASDLSPTDKPMMSLRDVEEQALILGSRTT
jgi:hypothetical protein